MVKVEVNFICQIPHLKLSCWGCCGRDWKSQKAVERQIDMNTFEFNKIKVPSTIRLLIFRDRFSEDCWDVSNSGICTNLVKFEDGTFACPLHEDINKLVSKRILQISKKDLRWGHCDVNCTCESVILFNLMSKEQKEEYIKWLAEQNFNHYDYSIGNVEGKIIRQFLDERNKVLDY